MNTVTIDVRSLADNLADFATAWKTSQGSEPRISFESSEALWKTLTAKRWQLLKTLTGAGPVTIREAARRVGRDVKAVHGDVHALLNAGLLDKTDSRVEHEELTGTTPHGPGGCAHRLFRAMTANVPSFPKRGQAPVRRSLRQNL